MAQKFSLKEVFEAVAVAVGPMSGVTADYAKLSGGELGKLADKAVDFAKAVPAAVIDFFGTSPRF